MADQTEPADLGLIWGARKIAETLGVTERAAFHMLGAGWSAARRWSGFSKEKPREHG